MAWAATAWARMMMRMADSNSDGAISRAEFSASAAQHFDRMDTNKDGQVTSEERRAMRQQHRQGRGQHHGENHEMHGTAAPLRLRPQQLTALPAHE